MRTADPGGQGPATSPGKYARMRDCGICGDGVAYTGVDWPHWHQGKPVHLGCILGATIGAPPRATFESQGVADTLQAEAYSVHKSADLSESLELNLNMPDITRRALATTAKAWRLELECHGAPYKWTGMATSESTAALKAVADLSDNHPEFNRYKARVVACVEVSS